MKPRAVPLRLSVMFLLQYMVFGAQNMLLSGHMGALGFNGEQISYVIATGALGAMVAPLIGGWLADRFLPGQIFAGCCYLACAPLLYIAWLQAEFAGLWITMLLFALVHVPTMALTNAIALYHLGDSRRFGHIRVWGTIGWIAMNWGLSLYLRLWESWSPQESHLGDGLLVGTLLAVITGLYCFTLPHTPSHRGKRNPYAFLEAFRLLKKWNFAVLMAVSFMAAGTSPFLYSFGFLFLIDQEGGGELAASNANLVLSVGQVAEMVVMLLLAASLHRWGLRRTIFIGLAAQGLRLGAFVLGKPLWLVVAAQGLHGIGFTFFSIGSIIAVEALSGKDLRASAQGLLVFVNGGLGRLLGSLFSGWVYDYFALSSGGHAWQRIFLVPFVVTLAGALGFLILFREQRMETPGEKSVVES